MPTAGVRNAPAVLSAVVLVGASVVLVAVAMQQDHVLPLAAVVVSLTVYLQSPVPAWRRAGGVALILSVAITVGAVGQVTGPLLGILLLFIVEAARRERTEWVVATGLAACAAVVAGALLLYDGAATLDVAWVWSLALVPITGLAADRAFRWRQVGDEPLQAATAALDEVLALAERMPAGFDRWSVAMAVHEEIREVARANGAASDQLPLLLVVVDDLLMGVGNPIARRPVGLLGDLPTSRRRAWSPAPGHALPAAIATVGGGDRWFVHRLGGDDVSGVVLAPEAMPRAALDAVTDVLSPAAAALANVGRFERLEAHALSAARVRLAHDLHDGVAQALTHVRFELDLLSLARPDERDELLRIRSVADAALLEVRRTVDELRETVPLAARLERHVDLVRTFTDPQIHLDIDMGVPVPPTIVDDVFRVAQEALSNAIRHSRASSVHVSLTSDADGVALAVVDDGVGMHRGVGSGNGVGLGAMHSRARRLGATLVHRERRGGGTVLSLEVPRPHVTTATAGQQDMARVKDRSAT